MKRVKDNRRMNIILALLCLVLMLSLCAFSVINICAGIKEGITSVEEERPYIQSAAILLGLCGAFIAFEIFGVLDIEIPHGHFIYIAEIISAFMLILPVFIGYGAGNSNWIAIGDYSLQPSEMIKTVFIAVLTLKAVNYKGRMNRPPVLMGYVFTAVIFFSLVALERDFGSLIIYLAIFVVISLCAGVKKKYFAICGAVGLASLPIVWQLMGSVRRNRILIAFNPESDPLGYGYQLIVSRQAIANGGLYGVGCGNATVSQKLPACLTDMVFAHICEDFGIIGGIAVAFVLIAICVILAIIAKNGSRRTKLLSAGLCCWIALQSFISITMCLGIMPIVGITLPFLSSGGSSDIGLLTTMGLVITSVSKDFKEYNNTQKRIRKD